MGTVSATPSGLIQTPGAWSTLGGNADVVLADALDTTYLQGPSYAPDYARAQIVGLTDVTIPAGALISGVRVRMRAKDLSTYPWDSQGRAIPALNGQLGNGVASAYGQTAITDYTGGYETSKPGGGPWTVADVNALGLAFATYTDYFGSGNRFYMAAIDVLYNERPVVTASASSPFGVSRPTISWTIEDVEGDPQQAYDYAIFSAAQYGIGGFNPASSPATYRSGEVTSGAQSVQVPFDLVNGTTYRAYVRTRQTDVSGQAMWADWAASNNVTINVTPPATPGISASTGFGIGASMAVAVSVTKNNSEANTVAYVEYSDDGGTTWTVHPAFNGVAVTGAVGSVTVFYDYELPALTPRRWRARIIVGGTAGSGYSATAGPITLNTGKWWLKDPLYPNLNIAPRISGFRFTLPEPQATSDPVGRAEHVIVSEGVQGAKGTLAFETLDKAAYDALMAITTTGRVLLLQDTFGRQWYLKLGESHEWELVHALDPTSTYPVRHWHRASYTWTQVARQLV